MSILIDPPLWPAHGTLFSHVVSDSSLEELHAFAHRVQLAPRAFDRDHYDVAQGRYEDLVAAGAHPVSGGELVRRLIGSGIRVPSRFRPEKLDGVLMRRWSRTLQAPELGRELLAAWSEAHRAYHDRVHLLSVLEALEELVPLEVAKDERQILELTAWFHDAVYERTGQDEQLSARMARARLYGLVTAGTLEQVQRLVLMTAAHRPEEHDYLGQFFSDADLEVLARPAPAYGRYAKAIRQEYAHVPRADFASGRTRILTALLEKEHIFATEVGRTRWEAPARENIGGELEKLSHWLPGA